MFLSSLADKTYGRFRRTFDRMARDKEHLQFLDEIRGVAILAVLSIHCLGAAFGHDQLQWRGWVRDFHDSSSFLALLPATYGWAGVAIFFAVSGFCIHLSFIRGQSRDWGGFIIRRFFRIYPPYLVALLVFALVFPTTHLRFCWPFDWVQFASHVYLVNNFGQDSYFGINPSFWSIAVEVQLYLIYPALIGLVRAFGWRRTMMSLCVLEVALCGSAGVFSMTTGNEVARWFSGSPFFYWYSWGTGAAVADAYVSGRPLPFRRTSPAMWLVLAIGCWLVRPLAPFSFLCFSLLTASVIAKVLDGQWNPKLMPFASRHLCTLGVWSYSFYLLHQPVVGLVARVMIKLRTVPPHPLWLFATCLCTYPITLAISRYYYRHCELRSIEIGRGFIERRRQKEFKPAAPAKVAAGTSA